MAKPKQLPYDATETEAAYSVTLHNTSGGSDKIYKISIEPAGGLWVVNYANGRRGGTLATGTKTKAPVSYAEARKACTALLSEKVGGGYVPIAGTRFADGMTAEAIAAAAREASGYVPQLLAPISEDDIQRYIRDPDYVAEPKHDGERRMLVVRDGIVSGGNRKGQTVALPRGIAELAATFGRDVTLDGEQIGDRFVYWDVLSIDGVDLKSRPWQEREVRLNFDRGSAIQRTVTARTEAEKRKLVEDVRAAGGEGVVFKHRGALYDPGKPGSRATWFKAKFWQSLSAVVGKVNDKRSVGLELIDGDGRRVQVGNVTIPPNHQVPTAGDVVEVGYLYAYDGGSLFQPTYLGKRNDIDVAECLASQRVFKAEEQLEEVPSGPRM
jgi:bifunctional non-homologous end joining protein LigD